MDKRTLPNEILLEEAATLLDEGRDVVIMPRGFSMLPFIRGDRDTVTLRKMPGVAVGDMCLVRLYEDVLQGHSQNSHSGRRAGTGRSELRDRRERISRYVLHRVITVDGGRITLMGDGNIRGTESCTTDDVIGTVIAIHKPSGRTVTPGSGRFWRRLLPVRRWILAFYHRWLRCGNILKKIYYLRGAKK